MIFLKILKNIGFIINILSYINFFASILANKTGNNEIKAASGIFSKIVAFLALNFKVSNVSDIDGMPKK